MYRIRTVSEQLFVMPFHTKARIQLLTDIDIGDVDSLSQQNEAMQTKVKTYVYLSLFDIRLFSPVPSMSYMLLVFFVLSFLSFYNSNP